MNNSEKKQYEDDGHTIFSMEGVGNKRDDKQGVGLSRKEKRSAIKAAFQVYLPVFLLTVGCFALVCVLLYFWLK